MVVIVFGSMPYPWLPARDSPDSFSNTLVAPNLTLGGTDSRYFLPLTQNVFRFAPIRMTPEDASRFHGINERIAIKDMGEAAAFYYRLISRMPAANP